MCWGSGSRTPSRRRPMGVWRRSPQPPEAGDLGAKPVAAGGNGGLGAESPAIENFAFFFAKITSF